MARKTRRRNETEITPEWKSKFVNKLNKDIRKSMKTRKRRRKQEVKRKTFKRKRKQIVEKNKNKKLNNDEEKSKD